MKRNLISPLLLGTCLICSPAVEAKATATRLCVAPDCSRIEIRVSFEAGADAGKPGAFGVLATTRENSPKTGVGNAAYWTTSGGWLPLRHGELVSPATPFFARLPGSKEYVIFEGTKEDICRLSQDRSFNVFAWHVGLSQSQFQGIESFMSKYEIDGWQADNLLNSVLFYEANKQRKVSLVYTVTCPSGK
ncbi:MAG TPA: hypothetical protein DCK83_00930 [Gallionellaceae bacterium]|nr:hypothetical protein [Gallionellaceae bacterium]